MGSNARNANGHARRKVRARLKAEGRGCWICRAFGRPDAINYDLPPGLPDSFEADELIPVSKYRQGNYRTANECALDYANLDAAHRRCNQWRGNKSVGEVLLIARKARENKPDLPQPWEI